MSQALAGFFLSGFLFALLGAILPAWGYHLEPRRFDTVGSYFLVLIAAVIAAAPLARWVGSRRSPAFLSAIGAGSASASLLFLAAVTPPAGSGWRMVGVAGIGLAGGLLNTGLFHALSGSYHRDAAATVVKGGALYGAGCLAATLLVAGSFYAYTVSSILLLMAVVPGYFALLYARARFPVADPRSEPSLGQAIRDFRSPGAVLFALLLFFQFGNEWAVAGWLPLFLIRRIGMGPKSALWLLALYWLALLAGRLVAVSLLGRVRHSRLLMTSVLAALFGCFLLFFTDNRFGAGTGALLMGLGFASIYPLVAERVGRRFSYYHPGFFNGILSFGLVGGMLAPASLGYLAQRVGIGVVMLVPLLGTFTVLVLLLLIWLETKVSYGN